MKFNLAKNRISEEAKADSDISASAANESGGSLSNKAKRSSGSDTLDLTSGGVISTMMAFAMPLICSNLLQQLYNAVDTMVVGTFCGDTALAAMGCVTPIYELLVGFCVGVGNGMAIVTARYFGRNDIRMLKKSVAASIVTCAFLTVFIMLVTHFFMYRILELLDTPAAIIDQSYEYIGLMLTFVVVMIAYNACASMMRAVGNSLAPLVFLLISCTINIVLDIILVPDMGIMGVAGATVISQGISVVLCLIYINKRCSIIIPSFNDFTFDAALYADVNGQGFSMGFMSCLVSIGTVILQFSVNGFGTLIIAGHAAARRLTYFCMVFQISWGLALSTYVSQNVGAGKRERVIEGVRKAHIISAGFAVLMILLNLALAPQLIGLISGSDEALVINTGARYMRFDVLFYPILGVLFNLRNSLQGLGRKIIPLVASIIECIGKIIFVILIIPVMGYNGMILCEPVIWIVMTLQLIYAYKTDRYIKGKM